MEVTPFHGEGQAGTEQSEDVNTMLDLKAMKPELDNQPLLSWWVFCFFSFHFNSIFILSLKHHRHIILVVTFSHTQHFVNPACIPPSYLTKHSNHVCIANAGSYPPNVLLLMTGAMSECNLHEPYETIWGMKMICSHRIRIFPFLLEYECTMACIGLTLRLNQVMAGVVAGSVYFSTRSECMFFCCLSLLVSDNICRQASDSYRRTSQALNRSWIGLQRSHNQISLLQKEVCIQDL